MLILDSLYESARNSPGDISEHANALRSLASGKRVLELGVRYGMSTVFLLAGRPTSMLSVDLAWFGYPAMLPTAATEAGIRWSERQQDSGDPLPEEFGEFDVCFVDTKHTAEHVQREIMAHAHRIRERMAFHDTVTNGEVGEDGSIPGIMDPIKRLLLDTGEWHQEIHYPNNNGLLILKRADY